MAVEPDADWVSGLNIVCVKIALPDHAIA